jgi:8-oxo-dGTP pyrophosphatase MutT (NUDIX family)
MENLLPVIRNAARALIVKDNRLLLLRKDGGERGERYALPGGAQDPGETLIQALNRECMEEIGSGVEVRDLLHVADFFKPRETDPPSTKHLVEFLFDCTVPEGYTPKNGYHPDKHQIEVVWMDLQGIGSINLFPKSLASYLTNPGGSERTVYLGTID